MSYTTPTLVLVGAAQHLVLAGIKYSGGGSNNECPLGDGPQDFLSDTAALW